jgi:predicted house-cleaning NTP pyrophosphatase (Maf/HAM1 superfamily)
MKKFNQLTKEEKSIVSKTVYDRNIKIASIGLNGFDVQILKPTKENLKKFQDQFAAHPMCGCYACIQLGKTFIENNVELKENVIAVSTEELENSKF